MPSFLPMPMQSAWPSAFSVVRDVIVVEKQGCIVHDSAARLAVAPVIHIEAGVLGMEHGAPGEGPADTFPEPFWPELRLYVPPAPVVPAPPAGTGQTRLLSGAGFNYLARSTTGVWVTDEVPAHPHERLFDGRCDLAFQFEAGPDREVDIDLGTSIPVDFLSVHGHNLDPAAIGVELRSSRDNFGVDDRVEAVAAIGQPSFAAVLPVPVSRRFWRIRFAGENPEVIRLGEVVVGLSRRLIRAPEYPLAVENRERTERDETDAGDVYVTLLSTQPRRTVSLEYWLASEDVHAESRDELFGRAGDGTPIVILPSDLDPSLVVYGQVAAAWEAPLKVKDRWFAKYVVTEDAFPGEEE